MNNNLSKKIIIICTFIVIAIIILIIFLLITLKRTDNEKNDLKNTNMVYVDNTDSNRKDSGAKANYKPLQEESQSKLIEKNDYNTFTIQAVTEEMILSKYLEDYKYNAINHIEDSYSSLDKEYREKKFGNIEEYKNYLNKNKENINDVKLSKYQINKFDTYDQYICLDQYNNYYIFNKLPNMSYTVILDTYTVDLPQFLEKYNTEKNANKVAMNAEKIKNALNNEDYKYVYDKLDNTFKQNNYPTLEAFENYIKNNLFRYNQFNYTEAREENGIYVLTLEITDLENKQDKKINATIIMKLEEGTDFVMSFSNE